MYLSNSQTSSYFSYENTDCLSLGMFVDCDAHCYVLVLLNQCWLYDSVFIFKTEIENEGRHLQSLYYYDQMIIVKFEIDKIKSFTAINLIN